MWGPAYYGTAYAAPAFWGAGSSGGGQQSDSAFWGPAYDGQDYCGPAYWGPSIVQAGNSVIGLRAAVYAYLAAQPSLTALIDGRFYPAEPDEGTAPYPYLVYEIHKGKSGGVGHGMGRSYGRNLRGTDGTSEAHITLTATGMESDCIAILRVLAAALQDFRGTLSDVVVMDSNIQIEFDAAQKPAKGSTHYVHQAGAVYRIRHRATPATA